MKKLFLTLVVAFATVCGFAQVIDHGQFNDYMSRGGDVVLKGRFENYSQSEMPQYVVANVMDYFSLQKQNQLVKVNADGTFCGTVKLPHSQICFIDASPHTIIPLLSVGDTLEAVFTPNDYVLNSRNNHLADIFTESQNEIYKRYADSPYGDLSQPYIYSKDGNRDTIQWAIERNIDIMEQAIKDIRRGRIVIPDSLSPLACEMVKSNILFKGLSNIVELLETWRFSSGSSLVYDEKAGEYKEVVKNTTAKPLDLRRLRKFFIKHEKDLFDNPCVLFNSSTFWALFNSLRNTIYAPLYHGATTYAPAGAEQDVADYALWHILPREYYDDFLDKALPLSGDTLYTQEDRIRQGFENIYDMYGISSSSFLSQMALTLYVFGQHFDGVDGDKYITEKAKAAMPFITHPVVAHHFLELYRKHAVANENTVVPMLNAFANEVADRVLSPYKGNVLFLDFWSYGCGPCRAGMLEQRELVERMKGKPVKFIYIASTEYDDVEHSTQWLKEKGINGEALFVDERDWTALKGLFNFTGTPALVLIGRDGFVHDASHDVNALEKEIEELLK